MEDAEFSRAYLTPAGRAPSEAAQALSPMRTGVLLLLQPAAGFEQRPPRDERSVGLPWCFGIARGRGASAGSPSSQLAGWRESVLAQARCRAAFGRCDRCCPQPQVVADGRGGREWVGDQPPVSER
jgi:hypothetical protein